jgi:hypothetical protein
MIRIAPQGIRQIDVSMRGVDRVMFKVEWQWHRHGCL